MAGGEGTSVFCVSRCVRASILYILYTPNKVLFVVIYIPGVRYYPLHFFSPFFRIPFAVQISRTNYQRLRQVLSFSALFSNSDSACNHKNGIVMTELGQNAAARNCTNVSKVFNVRNACNVRKVPNEVEVTSKRRRLHQRRAEVLCHRIRHHQHPQGLHRRQLG